MEFLEIKDREKYNAFIKSVKHAQFLQSWQWGEFEEKIGNKVIRVGVEDGGELRAAATLVKKNIGLGKGYFFSPRGPVINYQAVCGLDASKCKLENISSIEAANVLFAGIKKIARKEKAIFYRFEPSCSGTSCPLAVKSAVDIEPKETIMLDLDSSEEELLKAMHQKTRYNIRLAERKGVEIKEARASERFDDFWHLMTMTCERDCFRVHSYGHYKKMLELDNRFMKLFVAELNGRLLSAGIFAFFGDTAVYVHGASANEDRETMAPYLLQWHVIKFAKQAGFKYYDFYGIDEKKWPGVTRFKRGFKGEEITYPGTFDMVFTPILYKLYQKVRNIKRSLGKKK